MRALHDHSLYINSASQRNWAVSTLTEQPLYTHRYTHIHTHKPPHTHTYKRTCHHSWSLDDNDPYYEDFGAPPLRDYGFRFNEHSKPRLDFSCEQPGQAEVSLLLQCRGRQEVRSARGDREDCGQATFQVLSQFQSYWLYCLFPPPAGKYNALWHTCTDVYDNLVNFSSTNWSQPEGLP